MKAVVILLLGGMLVGSCFAMPRKGLTTTDETQAHDKLEAMHNPASSGNGVESDTGTHHHLPPKCFNSTSGTEVCKGYEHEKN